MAHSTTVWHLVKTIFCNNRADLNRLEKLVIWIIIHSSVHNIKGGLSHIIRLNALIKFIHITGIIIILLSSFLLTNVTDLGKMFRLS